MTLHTIAVLVALWIDSCHAVVSLPNLEFNAALGQHPYASSYYKFDPNPILDTKYVPGNAIDGLVMQTSWWSSGTFKENVYFQVNFTAESPVISKVVIRWHGYLAAKSYSIKTSYSGFDATFMTFNTFENASPEWDRIDTIVPWSNTSSRFYYLRIEIYSPVGCRANNTVECDTSRRRLLSGSSTLQGPIYGIREVEVWAASQKSGKELSPVSKSTAFVRWHVITMAHHLPAPPASNFAMIWTWMFQSPTWNYYGIG